MDLKQTPFWEEHYTRRLSQYSLVYDNGGGRGSIRSGGDLVLFASLPSECGRLLRDIRDRVSRRLLPGERAHVEVAKRRKQLATMQIINAIMLSATLIAARAGLDICNEVLSGGESVRVAIAGAGVSGSYLTSFLPGRDT